MRSISASMVVISVALVAGCAKQPPQADTSTAAEQPTISPCEPCSLGAACVLGFAHFHAGFRLTTPYRPRPQWNGLELSYSHPATGQLANNLVPIGSPQGTLFGNALTCPETCIK